MDRKTDKLAVRLPAGRKRTHGGYSFLTTGRLPEHRRYVLKYLTAARQQMVKDIGGKEENLSAQQIILVDRVISKLGILRCIEEHIRETTVIMKTGDLAPALQGAYLAYSNSLRLDLQALGIKRLTDEEPSDLRAFIKAFDERRTARQPAAKDQPGQDSRDSGALEDPAGASPGGGQAKNEDGGPDDELGKKEIARPRAFSRDIQGD